MIHALTGSLSSGSNIALNNGNTVDLEKISSMGPGSIAGALSNANTTNNPIFNFSQASAIPPAVTGTANIAMSPSANNNASTPVFSENAQQAAEKVFGSQDQRQGSVNGFKQEVKDRIMSDVASL
jgi:hypothetical protein